MISNDKEKGISLIGILVALFLLSLCTIAAMQLLARTQHATGISRERFIATNLAREGLELVQWVRDSNWLIHNENPHSSNDWTDHPSLAEGICLGGGVSVHNFTIARDNLNGADIKGASAAHNGFLFISTEASSKGEYNHDDSGEATPYKRMISVDCSQKDDANGGLIKVTSTVTWPKDSANPKKVELKENLYNWY